VVPLRPLESMTSGVSSPDGKGTSLSESLIRFQALTYSAWISSPVDFLIERFVGNAEKPAVIAPSARCAFGELADAVGHWAGELDGGEVHPGAVVGLEGDFSPASVALFLALAGRNAIVVPQGRGRRFDRAARDGLSQLEIRVRVDESDGVSFERTGRIASHDLYEELRGRGHPGLLQFSSGTSGEPKAAVHDLTFLLEKFEVRRPALTTLAFLLFDHLGGINTMLHTLSNGATLVSVGDRSPDPVCRLIEEHGVELLPATPTFLNLLLLSGAHRRYDLSSLRVISYGAESMSATTLTRLHEAFPGVKLQQTYGMIELGAMRTKSRDDGSLWVKVGGEGFETRVLDGMLQVRARSMLLGYLNAPTPITADGWFATGDMVEQDGEYLRFLGRDSDLINVGGEKVYPAEVEGVIESMDGVVEATVYGEPNDLVGQIVCARVTPRGDDVPADLARQVKRFCGERLERFKVPVRVEVLAGGRVGERVKKSRRPAGGGR
jgi:long-chain acyl-CoA synthetase